MFKIISEFFYYIILSLPIVSPIVSVKIFSGKLIWTGYLLGVGATIFITFLLAYTGYFNGETKALFGAILIFLFVPSSIVFGALCTLLISVFIGIKKN